MSFTENFQWIHIQASGETVTNNPQEIIQNF